jgi:hypothetical protein
VAAHNIVGYCRKQLNNTILNTRSNITRILLYPLHWSYLMHMPDSSRIDGTKLVSGCKIPHKPIRNWWDVKYPLIPEESGSQRGMTSEGDIS